MPKPSPYWLWLCLLPWFIVACAAKTPAPVAQTHTKTPAPTVTSLPNLTPSATPTTLPPHTPSAIPSPIATETPAKQPVCVMQQEFKLVDLPIDHITRLAFADENSIAVAGWMPRPAPNITPTPGPSPTPTYGDFVISPRHAYYRVTLNLADGKVTPVNLQLEPLNNPCGEKNCTIEVVDQSPDGQWQLLHIWANGRGAEGAWLVGKENTQRLGEPYVPTNSFWQWAQDSSLLWYQREGPGYGLTAETYAVQLDTPPVMRQAPVDWDHPLDSNAHRPVFSPVDKTGYSVRRFETQSDHFEWPDTHRYSFNATHSLTQTTGQEVVPDLVQVMWNEANQRFWQLFVRESGVMLEEISGEWQLLIPQTFFDGYMAVALMEIMPQANVAIAPSGKQVALNLRGNRVLLFKCDR